MVQMKPYSALLIALCLVPSFACSEIIYDDLTQNCDEGPCGIPATGDGSYTQGRDEAFDAAKIVGEVVCGRAHSDCSELCDIPGAICGDSRSQCVENFARAVVEDLAVPMSSDRLAQACAQQIEQRSCTDLSPDSPECDFSIVEGCGNDDDEHGYNYSWLASKTLSELPSPLNVSLCESVSEWFSFRLEANERLKISLLGGTGQAWVTLHAPVGAPGGRQDVDQIKAHHIDALSANETEFEFDPVPRAGAYYLELDLNRAPYGTLQLSIGSDLSPPQSAQEVNKQNAKIAYDALCQRLHGDCASVCSDPASFCGSDVAACSEAFAQAAIDRVAGSRLNDPKLIDAASARTCADAIAASGTCELGQGVPSCDSILGNAECRTQDPTNFARPTAWQLARSLESVPVTLDLQLCEEQSQWFAIELNAGQRLSARLAARPTGTVRARLYVPNSSPEDRLEQRNAFEQRALDDRWDQLDAAPVSGTYFLEFENGLASTPAQVELAIE